MNHFTAGEVEGSVPARFARVAGARAGALAIVTEGERLTYAQLDRRSDTLAAAVARATGPTDTPVAVIASEPAATIVAMLAVWKAGRFCVPLDGALPPARLAVILRDAEAGLLLADDATAAGRLSGASFDGHVLRMDEMDLDAAVAPPTPALTADTLACLLYTSGSTGEPKGVVRTHRNLLHRARCAVASLAIGPDDRVSALHSPAFGAGLRDVLAALLGGATLLPFDVRSAGLVPLAAWINRERITVLCAVVTTLRRLVASLPPDERFPSVRAIRLGSEPLFDTDVERLRARLAPDCLIIAGYGASEASGIVEYRIGAGTPLPRGRVPAGYPLEGVEILVLDEAGTTLEVGRVGEVAVRSRYLSPGYWRRPDRTRAQFHGDAAGAGVRTYRTGDLGRLAPDGCLEVLGRHDQQVKVRGYLVHPGEIERRLAEHPEIREAAVVGWAETGETRLVAYVVPTAQPGPTEAALRRFVQSSLPAYMVPSAFVSLEALPVTGNGKLDRAALPSPPAEGARPTVFVPAVNSIEHQIAQIWEDLFDVRPVGASDDFAALGGDSLLAAAFIAELEARCGLVLSPSALLEAGTVTEIAARLVRDQASAHRPLVAIREGGARTPFFYLHGDYNGGGLYCRALAHRLDPERAFYVIHPHGVDGRALPDTIEEMAAERLAAIRVARPRGPYLLGGYCNGALVALEIARRLSAEGERVGVTVLVDAHAPVPGRRALLRALDSVRGLPGLSTEQRAALSAGIDRLSNWAADRFQYYETRRHGFARAPWDVRARWVARALAGVAGGAARRVRRALRSPRPAEVFHLPPPPPSGEPPRHRRHVYRRAFRRYAPTAYDGRVVLLRAADDPSHQRDLGWSRLLPSVEVHVIPGEHLTCITRHVGEFTTRLEEVLRSADDTSRQGEEP